VAKPILSAVCVCMIATSLRAQEILGTWQGTVAVAQPERVVLRVTKDEAGALRASSYQPGTGLNVLPMTSFTFTPPMVTTEQAYAGMKFEGKLSGDGKSITGTWTEGKQNSPLTLNLVTGDEIWKPDYAGQASMAADADPSFDVATIKPTSPNQQMARYGVRTRNFKAVNQSVSDLIGFAYHLQARQIEGAPAWATSEHFDLAGKPDLPGQPSEEQYRLMLRKLLAERFNLKVHTEQKEFPVFALTMEKGQPPLTKSDLTAAGYHNSLAMRQSDDGQVEGQFSFYSMADFTETMMNFIHDRQIVDETGLQGRFDFTMRMPLEQGHFTPDEIAIAMFEALKSRGFKLVAKKEPLNVVVVDHVERPSPN
jgi:uncharacterized protein (TIGR03435 family)